MSYPSKWQCRVHKTMPQQTSKHVSTNYAKKKMFEFCEKYRQSRHAVWKSIPRTARWKFQDNLNRPKQSYDKNLTVWNDTLPWLDLHVEILAFYGDKDLCWVRYVVCMRHGDILFLAQTYTVHLSTCIVFPPLLFFRLWPPPMSNELILHGCGPGLPYCSNSWNKLTHENIK